MVLAIKFTSQNIYISEQKVESGCIKVIRTFQEDMPEGAYQKGVILNTADVSVRLAEIVKKHNIRTRKTTVCLNGLDIVQKEFTIPSGTENQMRGILENEMKKIDLLKNDFLFDFACDRKRRGGQDEDNMVNVVAYLMPRQLVQNYIQTFRRAGLKLVSLKPFHDSMDKLIRLLKLDQQETTTILAYAEHGGIELCMTGSDMKNMYRSIRVDEEDAFEENIYILSSKQNLQAGKEPEQDILDRLTENISKLVQFQSQNSRNHPVGKIILYGELAQRSSFLESVKDSTGIDTSRVKLPERLCRQTEERSNLMSNFDLVAVNASRLVGEWKALSFTKQYQDQRGGSFSNRDRLPVYIMLGLTSALAVGSITVTVLNYKTGKQIKSYEESIEAIITSEKYQEQLLLTGIVEQYTAYNQLCEQYIQILEGTGRLESGIIRQLDDLKPEGTTIASYSLQNGILSVSCMAVNQEGPAAYAKKVTEAGIFQKVTYAGFQLETGIEGNTYYRFVLDCVIEQGGS